MTAVTATAREQAHVPERTGRRSGLVEVIISICMAGSLAACATAPNIDGKSAAIDRKLGVSPSPKVAAVPAKNSRSTQYASREAPREVARGGGFQKLGSPYRIAGKLYVPQRDPDYDQVGLASWYGKQFHGRLTANGERFDMNSLSAAHPTMPLPAYARVTNVSNGRSVIVRVNDRGPFAHDRLIDLSKKTAAVLDFKHQGTTKVRVQFVGDAPLDGHDEKFLLASYQGPEPGPVLAANQPETVLAAYSAPPAPRPQAVFPDGLAADELDRSVVESGTPFDPSGASSPDKAAARQAASDPVKSSYTANHRVSLAFAAIDGLTR